MRNTFSKFFRVCVLALFISVVSVLPVSAEVAPEEVVKKMLADLKSQGTPVALINYVHWETAFSNMNENERHSMNIKTPEDLREFSLRVISDPVKFMEDEMRKRAASFPVEQKEAYDKNTDKLVKTMRARSEEMKKKLVNSSYTVGKAKIDGLSAKVPLEVSVDGKSQKSEVPLIKVGDSWYLVSANPHSSLGSDRK